jgi:hypothetical protein
LVTKNSVLMSEDKFIFGDNIAALADEFTINIQESPSRKIRTRLLLSLSQHK